MSSIKEFIIQWNGKGSLDLFEYTKDKEIIRVLFDTYALDIINYIFKEKENKYVWIERMPIDRLIIPELDKINIPHGRNIDAEKWNRQMWRDGNRNMSYISYWHMHKPTRIEDLEQIEFDFKKFSGIGWIE